MPVMHLLCMTLLTGILPGDARRDGKSLFSAGYELTQDASRCTRLANADRRDISRKVTSVRHRYMTPSLRTDDE
jgi:hypothetical protein